MEGERRYSNVCLRRFGRKWLGLFSAHDEAINTIKSSVGLNLPIISKREDFAPVFYTERVFPFFYGLQRQFNKLYNLVMPWLGNQFVSSNISKAIQGADRPGSLAIDVRTHPGLHEKSAQPLPQVIDTQLLALANGRAASLIPHLRPLLYTFMENPLRLTTAEEEEIDLTGGLVHTSYFDLEEILTILIEHIRLTTAQPIQKPQPDSPLVQWILTSKQAYARHLAREREPTFSQMNS